MILIAHRTTFDVLRVRACVSPGLCCYAWYTNTYSNTLLAQVIDRMVHGFSIFFTSMCWTCWLLPWKMLKNTRSNHLHLLLFKNKGPGVV